VLLTRLEHDLSPASAAGELDSNTIATSNAVALLNKYVFMKFPNLIVIFFEKDALRNHDDPLGFEPLGLANAFGQTCLEYTLSPLGTVSVIDG
jgi:hypothetical protein